MKLLGTISSIFAFLYVFACICSFFYENTFIWYLNSSNIRIPLTISDISTSFIIWLPTLIIPIFVIIFFELLSRRIEKGMSNEEIIATSPNPEFTRKFRASPEILFKWIARTALILWLLFGKINLGADAISLALVLCIFWYMDIGPFLSNTPLIQIRRHPIIKEIIILVPYILIFFCFKGISDAHRAIYSEPFSKTQNEIVLKYYDRGKIVLNKGKINWCANTDKSCTIISNKEPMILLKGLLCSKYNLCIDV